MVACYFLVASGCLLLFECMNVHARRAKGLQALRYHGIWHTFVVPNFAIPKFACSNTSRPLRYVESYVPHPNTPCPIPESVNGS